MNKHLPMLNTQIKSRGVTLDTSKNAFGLLEPTCWRDDDPSALRANLSKTGYLFVRDMFEPQEVLDVRKEICHAMNDKGLLDPNSELLDCVPRPEICGNNESQGSATFDSIPNLCPSMHQLLYGDRTISFFKKLFGGLVRHYDLTWFRGIAPGLGTVPHCDVVYMGRGTHELLTCWVPYGDISLKMGGLMLLEGSIDDRVQARIKNYLNRDVDEYCENRKLPEHVDLDSTVDNKVWNGWLARTPARIRENLGGRWLTAEYRPGDALIFSCKLIHGSLDNQSDRFRLSSDSRYQSSDQSIDDRFIGDGPLGHVGRAKRGRVC